jgi:hypothetical protein
MRIFLKKLIPGLYVLLVLAAVSIHRAGCKKNSDTGSGKGCNDPESLNYSATAKGTVRMYLPGRQISRHLEGC